MAQIRRSKTHRGVYRRCSCPEGSRSCGHWSFDVEVRINGARRKIAESGFENATAANEARDAVVSAHRAGKVAADSRTTFGEWLRGWIDERTAAGELRPSTERSYRDLAETHLIPRLGNVKLAKLRGRDLTKAYRAIVADRNAAIAEVEARNAAWLKANPDSTRRPYAPPRAIGPSTIRRIHAVASGALTTAMKRELIAISPAPAAELPKASKRKVTPWTPEHYSAFLATVAKHRLFAAFHLVGHTGLRRAEVAGLRWPDVDFDGRRLTVNQTRVSVGYKVHTGDAKSEAGHERVIPLDAGTVALLREWRKRQAAEAMAAGPAYDRDGQWLVADELGAPVHPEMISKTFKRLATKAGLPVTKLHGLRHMFAWALRAAGVDIASASKLLGHSSITVTSDIYSGLWDDVAGEAAEGVAGVFRNAREA